MENTVYISFSWNSISRVAVTSLGRQCGIFFFLDNSLYFRNQYVSKTARWGLYNNYTGTELSIDKIRENKLRGIYLPFDLHFVVSQCFIFLEYCQMV